MKETGLMFKAPLVRAILSDQKIQTRRAFSGHMVKQMRAAAAIGEVSHFLDEGSLQPNDLAYVQQFSPVGQPGDRIYVRETWSPDPPCDGTWCYTSWAGCRQGQIEGVPERFRSPEHCMYAASTNTDMVWMPSVHMPKWAARIWLEITGVRVERLQDITDADALAEGVDRTNTSIPGYARERFRQLWESTGGDWAANPWVWVIDFKRIEKPR